MAAARPEPETGPGGAVMLDAFEADQAQVEWKTGTAIDEFTPIYRSFALATKQHGPMSPADLDGMDLTVVALLMGIGTDPGATDMADFAELARRRRAGEDVSWDSM